MVARTLSMPYSPTTLLNDRVSVKPGVSEFHWNLALGPRILFFRPTASLPIFYSGYNGRFRISVTLHRPLETPPLLTSPPRLQNPFLFGPFFFLFLVILLARSPGVFQEISFRPTA